MNPAASTTQPPAIPARMFARLPTVIEATGLGRSTIYRLVATGAFPPPVHLGPRAVAWRWSDLDRWGESRRVDTHSVAGSRAARRVKGGRSPAPAALDAARGAPTLAGSGRRLLGGLPPSPSGGEDTASSV